MKWLSNGKVIFFAVTISLFGCGKKNIQPLNSAGLISGLASPIQLDPNQTTLNLQDWVLRPENIDSVTVNKDLQKTREGSILVLTGNLSKPLGNLSIWSNGNSDDILLLQSDKISHTFKYSGNAKNVRVKGEFNAWNVGDGIFLPKGDDSFEFTASVSPGNYQYVLVVDGKEAVDPLSKDSVDNGQGGWNSLLTLDRPSPSSLPKIEGIQFTDERISLVSTTDLNGAFCYFENSRLTEDYVKIEGREITITIPQEAKQLERSFIRLWAFNSAGVSNDVLIPLHNGQVLSDVTKMSRKDKHGQVMYFLMIDRFSNGNTSNDRPVNDPSVHPKANYFGGDVLGVTSKIQQQYFRKLGVNTIWLSPITQNPDRAYGLYPTPRTTFSSYHGYWPISSTTLNDRFATENEFKAMVEAAHNSDANVILDYVANHVHEEHPIFKEHPDWATPLYLPDGTLNTEKWDEHRLTTWFDTFMPTLDLSRPEVIAPMTDSAIYWLNTYNLDGFRHDATKHIPLEFWRTLTKKIKQNIPASADILQIGETYGSRELIKSYISTGMLDAQFDFNLYDDAVNAFARPEISFERLTNSLKESLHYYGDHNLMGYITGNQDRPRFISYADGSLEFGEDTKLAGWTRKIEIKDTLAYDKLASLTAFMMAIPGIPVIYYGDEIGMPGGNDPDNRRMMLFENLDQHQTAHLTSVKEMINFRRSSLSILYGSTELLHESDDLIIIKREYFGEVTLCVFNKSDASRDLPELIPALKERAYFSLRQNTTKRGLPTVGPYSYDFLKYNKK